MSTDTSRRSDSCELMTSASVKKYSDLTLKWTGRSNHIYRLTYRALSFFVQTILVLIALLLLQYVCVHTTKERTDDETEKEAVLDLLVDHWKLPNPNLIVSIIGGAKRFQFAKSRITQLFKNGVLDIATTTGESELLTKVFHLR